MKQLVIGCMLLGSVALAHAQTVKTSNGKEQVQKLCGCFDVEFKYAETFSPNPNYKFHEREFISGGTELSLPIEVSDSKIVIQHLLVISDTMIIKHWREEWTYENPVIWKYQADKTWKREILPAAAVKGRWTQTIWEVSDEPRYQGISQFTNNGNDIVWQNTTDAPLPRREYSIRNDYNVLRRNNRIHVTDSGYVHEQDNQKIIRTNGKDQLLAEEKGWNIYKRLDNKQCAAGQKYWDTYQLFWAEVRKVWAQQLTGKETIALQPFLDGKPLHQHLFDLSKTWAKGTIAPAALQTQIKDLLGRYVKHDAVVATK